MDAERNNASGSQTPRGKATQIEGPDLESVIARAQGRDAEALGEIYRLYARRVLGLCRYMLDSRESAEDATSEIFLKLQRSIDSYDGSIPFLRWLLRVAGNQCIDVLRRRNRGRQVIVEVEEGVAAIEAVSLEPSPLSAVLSTEERAQVRDAIARLPENYRLPLVLRYYGELSYDEIAQQLGLQRNYVAALIFRAKQELRRKLGHREQVIMECYSEQIVSIFVDGELAGGRGAAPARPPSQRAGVAGNCWTHYALRTVFSAKACKSFRKK